ncbi:MAG: shikimate kinase [Marinoscillum sp.]|uniref:shikimate kinase n=1 Tax=Marinoscillum sp. TaxID=2024838 RepID=UPI003303D5F9
MKLGRIYLVGMPGSGKSYFGKQLASTVEFPFVDLDHEIELQEGREISAIFSEEGEEYFRKIESKMLISLSEKYPGAIISTGGGTPCFHKGMEYMKGHGITVFLEADRDLLIERIARKDHRPLMQGDVENRVNELLKARLPVYRSAHISIDHRDVDLLLGAIKAL